MECLEARGKKKRTIREYEEGTVESTTLEPEETHALAV